jgi:hypothetical protein
LEHRQPALEYALQFGRGLDHSKADTFVGMYVNDWTLDFGPRAAKRSNLLPGPCRRIIPKLVEPEFVRRTGFQPSWHDLQDGCKPVVRLAPSTMGMHDAPHPTSAGLETPRRSWVPIWAGCLPSCWQPL